jgi:hypothetical protein
LAAACAAAYELVRDKHMQRADMRGLTVSAAREIVVVARKDIAGLQRVSDMNHNYTETELDAAKKIVGKSAKNTADDYRKGKLAHKDLRTEVQLNVLRHARRDKPKLLPLFADFSKAVVNKIDGMLNDDRVARHIDEIVKVLPEITLEEDHATIRDIHHSLGQLTRRADKAVVRTTPSKVVKLKAITEDRP